MTRLNSYLKKQSLQSGFMDFPGFWLQAFYKGKKVANLKVGKTYNYYDFASITKVIFTTTYFMKAVTDKKVQLSQKVSSILPWYQHSLVKVADLLNHSAGNEWWMPYYKKIDRTLSLPQAYQQLEKLCQKAPRPHVGKRAVYSDLDFYLLGSIMQALENKPLQSIWLSLKKELYPKSTLHFNTHNKPYYSRSQYAPTEKCTFRKKQLQGEVHDENAWALGGVAPHAGLFGKISDLSQFGLLMRNFYFAKSQKTLNPKVVKKFTSRSLSQKKGDWGYGFMLPAKQGSSAGEKMSKKSFGHTGFTGTSLWFDPEMDLLVCILSNRVFPTRKNRGFIKLRPWLHDQIYTYLKDKK